MRCKVDKKKICYRGSKCSPKCDIFIKSSQQLLIGSKSRSKLPTTIILELRGEKPFCAYCLHQGKAENFMTKTKHGYSDKMFKCPECGQGMRKDTLFRDMTPEQYAEWVFDTIAWERIHWVVWKQRLHSYGWATRFWSKYNELKQAASETESYEDYILRKQYEQKEEET